MALKHLGGQLILYSGVYCTSTNFSGTNIDTQFSGSEQTIYNTIIGDPANLHAFVIDEPGLGITQANCYLIGDVCDNPSTHADVHSYISLSINPDDYHAYIHEGNEMRYNYDEITDVTHAEREIENPTPFHAFGPSINITNYTYLIFGVECYLDNAGQSYASEYDLNDFFINSSTGGHFEGITEGTRSTSNLSISPDIVFANTHNDSIDLSGSRISMFNQLTSYSSGNTINIYDSSSGATLYLQYAGQKEVIGSYTIRRTIAYKLVDYVFINPNRIGSSNNGTISIKFSNTTLLSKLLNSTTHTYISYNPNQDNVQSSADYYLDLYWNQIAYLDESSNEWHISDANKSHVYATYTFSNPGHKYEYVQRLELDRLAYDGLSTFKYLGHTRLENTPRSLINLETYSQSHFFLANGFNKHSKISLTFKISNTTSPSNAAYEYIESNIVEDSSTIETSYLFPVLIDSTEGNIIGCTSFFGKNKNILSADVTNSYSSTISGSTVKTDKFDIEFTVNDNSSALSYTNSLAPICYHFSNEFTVVPSTDYLSVDNSNYNSHKYHYDFYLLFTNSSSLPDFKKEAYRIGDISSSSAISTDSSTHLVISPNILSGTTITVSGTDKGYVCFDASTTTLKERYNMAAGTSGASNISPSGSNANCVLNKQYVLGEYGISPTSGHTINSLSYSPNDPAAGEAISTRTTTIN